MHVGRVKVKLSFMLFLDPEVLHPIALPFVSSLGKSHTKIGAFCDKKFIAMCMEYSDTTLIVIKHVSCLIKYFACKIKLHNIML